MPRICRAGQTQRAINLYEESLEGAFAENELVISRLIVAYYKEKRYEDVIRLAPKIGKPPQFARSKAHMLYARFTSKMQVSRKNRSRISANERAVWKLWGKVLLCKWCPQLSSGEEGRKNTQPDCGRNSQFSSVERRHNRKWLSSLKMQKELKWVTGAIFGRMDVGRLSSNYPVTLKHLENDDESPSTFMPSFHKRRYKRLWCRLAILVKGLDAIPLKLKTSNVDALKKLKEEGGMFIPCPSVLRNYQE